MPASWTPPYAGGGTDETMAVNTPAPELARRSEVRPPASAGQLSGAIPPGVPAPPVTQASNKRQLYVALGALLVVGVLFAAGLYLPRRLKIYAGGNKPSFPAQQPSTPAKDNPSAAPQALPVADNPVAVPDTSAPVPAPVIETKSTATDKSKRGGSEGSPGNAEQRRAAAEKAQAEVEAAAAASAKAQAAAAELEEAEHQEEQLTSRAESIAQSLDNLKRQQSGQGYGLRGDVVAAEQRMQTYMSKAQAALQRQDGPAAKKYFIQADKEIDFLEKFLGR